MRGAGNPALDPVGCGPVTTLDALIDKHGMPAFIRSTSRDSSKEALLGLTRAVKALSFEFTIIQRDVRRLHARCIALGSDPVQTPRSAREPEFCECRLGPAASDRSLAERLPAEANSGDIYAARA